MISHQALLQFSMSETLTSTASSARSSKACRRKASWSVASFRTNSAQTGAVLDTRSVAAPRLRSESGFAWSRVLEMVERLGSLVATYDNQSLNLTVSRRRLHIKYARECGLASHLVHVLPAAQPSQACPRKAAQSACWSAVGRARHRQRTRETAPCGL